MPESNSKSVVEYIYKGAASFSVKEYEQLKKESREFLLTPLKVMALLIAISGLFAMVFEVRHFSQYSIQVYITRLLATFIAFIVLVLMYTRLGREKPLPFVHALLIVIIGSSGYMIYLMPSTLVVNAQIVGLMIFTSALFLSWDVKNQIIVAIYYNVVFAAAILLNDKSIYFLPNMYESVIFVLFLSVISVIGSAVNFKLRMQLAERSFLIQLSEKKFHSIFENSVEGIFQSSFNGKFLTVNPALVNILGYESAEELLKVDIAKDVYINPEAREQIIKELEEKKVINNRNITLKKKDGTLVTVRLNDRMLTDEFGNQPYFEGNIEDITERVKIEEERKKAEEALRLEKQRSDALALEATQATKLKSQFLANMSHEIRTPMNGILGFLSLIEKGSYKDIDEMKQYIANAKQSAESLLDIINDILDLSKIEAGKMELESVDFNIEKILNDAISFLSPKSNEKGLQILTNISSGSILDVNGDPSRLRQIFLNLISNAIKFTEKGKILIDVKSYLGGKGVINFSASVEDEGIGIPEEKINTLFKAFSQVDGSNTRKYGGTGLGLVICKEFVSLMGGEIKVESKYGKGSKFIFTAKLKTQQRKKKEQIFNKPVEVSHLDSDIVLESDFLKEERTKYKVLLAEDNIINQKVALKILSYAGYLTEAVGNGLEAVEAVKNNDYNIVLMDVQMPEMDGFTATQKIRQFEDEKSKIPIIAITAHALMGDKEKCIAAGMNDYISKPIVAEKLLATMDAWLGIKTPKVVEKIKLEKGFEKLLDFSVLNKMSLGDKNFQKDLLKSFIQDILDRFAKLYNLIKTKEIEKITNEAHTIKGASYSVGANKIGDEALGIELSGKQKDLPSIIERMENLQKAIDETKVVINNFLSKETS
jgi:PAS domain S-box-containing protein